MTVSQQTPLNRYTGNGASTVFAFSFLVLASTDLVVTVTDSGGVVTTKTLGADYTVAGVGVPAGGTVTFLSAPASGTTVTIYRQTSLSRVTDYQNNGDLLAQTLDDDFDRVWLALQEIYSGARVPAGSVRAPAGETLSALPAAVARADRLVQFDASTGDAELSTFTASQIAAAIAALSPGGSAGTVVSRETLPLTTLGQTVLTFPTVRYTPGVNGLVVVAGGQVLPKSRYSETSTSSITLNSALAAGTEVEVIAARLVSSGVPLETVSKGLAEDTAGGASDGGSFWFRRRATYSGGTPGYVNAVLRADTFVESSVGSGASTAAAYEWAVVGVVHNYSNTGEQVGGYFQGIKYAGAGPTWGATVEMIDYQTDPASGAVGQEISFTANGTDASSARVALDVALRKRNAGGASPTLAWGIRVQTEAGSKVGRAFALNTSATADVAFDASLGTVNIAAFKMAQNQCISFTASDSRKLFYDGTGLKLSDAVGTLLFRMNDTGIPQFGIASTAAATPANFVANRTIRIQQLDGTVLYLPAMLATW